MDCGGSGWCYRASFNRADDNQIQNQTKPILGALTRLLKVSSQENVSALYQKLQADVLLSIADALQEQIKASVLTSETRSSRVAEVGRYFATRAVDRESTKFGILLLELSGEAEIILFSKLLPCTMSSRSMRLLPP